MKQKKYFLMTLLLAFSIHCQAQLIVQGYTNYNMHGFNVLVQDNAFVIDSTMTNTAINLVDTKLSEVLQLNISQDKKDSLKAVPIFMDWNKTTGAAQYHPSQSWLTSNGYIAQKAKCVEISNITNFVNWTNQNQPYMVLHELAHAYHHRVLNFNSAVINNAFSNAVNQNLYKNISYHNGGGNYNNAAVAYGLNNEKEFFAELTEAYFGLNDYFPFDYADLQGYDIVGFDMMIAVWGDITVSTEAPSLGMNTIALYPNPSAGMTTIDLGNRYEETISIQIFNSKGQLITKPITTFEGRLMPIYIDGGSGIYFVKIIQNEGQKVIRFLKQ
jgi:hypothetical protein